MLKTLLLLCTKPHFQKTLHDKLIKLFINYYYHWNQPHRSISIIAWELLRKKIQHTTIKEKVLCQKQRKKWQWIQEKIQIPRSLLKAVFFVWFFFFEKTGKLYFFLIELQKLAGSPSSALHVRLFISLANTANLDNEMLVYLINKELQSPKMRPSPKGHQ